MQSDIVQRLLRIKNRYDDGCSEDGKLHNPDGPEAAAEIARLTEALRDIVGVFTDPEAGEVDRNLAIRDARQALAGAKPC